MKALLATEQRIPGLGNGVLQDILFNAGIHPKCKKSGLTDCNKDELFRSLKNTLRSMTDEGGRDTEKDFFGKNGGYKTILSKNTVNSPCPKCGEKILKEAYLGGAVYYCPVCQKLKN
jgi:formamidopyrimidine-DNA glycosylase